jgi:hypothetical protein
MGQRDRSHRIRFLIEMEQHDLRIYLGFAILVLIAGLGVIAFSILFADKIFTGNSEFFDTALKLSGAATNVFAALPGIQCWATSRRLKILSALELGVPLLEPAKEKEMLDALFKKRMGV